jgi:predicted TIM-barrel fold metal-dependent hydrolase
LSRRGLIGAALAAGLGTTLASRAAGDAAPSQPRIVDTNVSLFSWPFRRLPLDEPERLVERLRILGVARAWAGSFEALLHRDVAGVNERLAEACGRFDELEPIGAVNLSLPDWQEDLRRCAEVHRMPGVRLLPAYHGYALDDPRLEELLSRAAEAGRFVQIAVSMEDVRTQHPLVQVRDVDLAPLPAVLRRHPQARVQLLNARLRGPSIKALAEAPNLYLDVARSEGTDGIPALLEAFPAVRVLLGSHAPFLIPEAVLIRIWESDLSAPRLRGLLWEHAEALCPRH